MATNSTLKEQPPLIPEADQSEEKTQKDSAASAKEPNESDLSKPGSRGTLSARNGRRGTDSNKGGYKIIQLSPTRTLTNM